MPSSPRCRTVLLVAVALGAGCRGGCGAGRAPARDELLSRLPVETRFVASVDLAKIRSTALWSQLSAFSQEDPADRKRIEELTARTGLDPLRQLDRIIAAFPDSARERGQYALVIDGRGFDEKRLVDYARAESPQSQIQPVVRGQHTLWTGSGKTAGFFPGATRFVLGGGGWAEQLADLTGPGPHPSAADNDELVRLCARLDRHRALWFAAIVPLDVRQMLLSDPRHDSAASVTRLTAAADLGPGLVAEMVADLSNADDAKVLVQRIQTSVREAKRDGKVLMLGLAPYLDAITARADGPTLRVTLSLAEPQVKDLVDRLAGFLRLARGRSAR